MPKPESSLSCSEPSGKFSMNQNQGLRSLLLKTMSLAETLCDMPRELLLAMTGALTSPAKTAQSLNQVGSLVLAAVASLLVDG